VRLFLATHRRVLARTAFLRSTSGFGSAAKGKSYSFVTYCRARHPSHEDKVPYNVSLVDLDEGPRLISNVIEGTPNQVTIGMPVESGVRGPRRLHIAKLRPMR